MRKIDFIILVGFLCFGSVCAQSTVEKDLKRDIDAIVDSVRSSYQSYVLYSGQAESVSSEIDPKGYFTIFIPRSQNLNYYQAIIEVVKPLSKSDNFFDRKVAHAFYNALVPKLSAVEDSLLLLKANTSVVRKLIQEALYSDIKNCLRLTNDEIFAFGIKKEHLNKEIINGIRLVLESPFQTKTEIEMTIRSRKPHYSLRDTIGYKKMKNAPKVKRDKYEEKIREIENHLRWAAESKMSLADWYKKKQKEIDDYYRKSIGTPLSLQLIIDFIGEERVVELSPSLEKLYQIGMKDSDKDSYINRQHIDIILARLQYKEYEKDVLSKISAELINPNENGLSKNQSILSNLTYLNSQNSYYTAAPLLLVTKDSIDYLMHTYTFGAYSFDMLRQYHIKNFPEVEDILNKETNNHTIWIDEIKLTEKLSNQENGFLQRMYKWMHDNKGKYEIR